MEITTADLLATQAAITNTVRHEVRQARSEFREKLGEIKRIQDAQDARGDRHARELARLEERTQHTSRGLWVGLTTKQKTALWSAAIGAGGVVIDGLRHIVVALLTLKGVHP